MGQKRYHNFEQSLESLHENNRLVNLIHPGVYAGYDDMEQVVSTTMKLVHTRSGAFRLNSDANAMQGPFGVVVSTQGTVIEDDTEFSLTVPYVVINPRIDRIVAQHTHLDSPGGSNMVISRIQGTEAVNPVAPPLTNSLIQVTIGYLRVNSSFSHAYTKYIPAPRKTLGGYYPFAKGEKSIFEAPYMDFNLVIDSGFYWISTTSAAPGNRPAATPYWLVLVLRNGDLIHQTAHSANSGKIWVRTSTSANNDNVIGWTAWQSLNNSDVPSTDFSSVFAAIGTRTYTEQNYVNNGESLTTSVDNLDIALALMNIAIGDIETDLSSVNGAIADLADRFGAAVDAADLNLFVKAGQYFVDSSVSNAPAGNSGGGFLGVFVNDLVIRQRMEFLNGAVWYRSSGTGGSAWTTWTLETYASIQIGIGTWNMSSTGAVVITPGINFTKIRQFQVMIRDDADTCYNDLIASGSSTVGANFISGQVIFDTGGTDLVLARQAGSIFDSASYDSGAPFNRGYVIIKYIPYD